MGNGPIEQISSIGNARPTGNENGPHAPNVGKRAANNDVKTSTQTETRSPVDKTSLDKAIEKANDALTQNNIRRQFVKDDELKGHLIVKLINKDTNEVIRQIPSEEAIKISKNIDTMLGMILDNKI